MTFTYIPTDDIGKVRRITGQTIEAESEVSDEEIEAWLIDTGNSVEKAAVKILRSLAATYSRRATITSGNEKIENGNVAKNILAILADLEDSLGTKGSVLLSKPVRRM